MISMTYRDLPVIYAYLAGAGSGMEIPSDAFRRLNFQWLCSRQDWAGNAPAQSV